MVSNQEQKEKIEGLVEQLNAALLEAAANKLIVNFNRNRDLCIEQPELDAVGFNVEFFIQF